jgi:hypothetical protein
MITPPLILWATDFPRSFELRSVLESTAIFAAAAAFGALAFGPLSADIPSAAPLAVLAVLPPIWAALRRGPRDTATAGLILFGFAAWGTVLAGSPLAGSVRAEFSTSYPDIHDRYHHALSRLAAGSAQRRRTEEFSAIPAGNLARRASSLPNRKARSRRASSRVVWRMTSTIF